MPTHWHDINEPAFYLRPTPKGDEQATGKGEDDATAGSPAQTARKPEIRILSAQFEPHPVHGYAMNKPCVVRGKAEFLQETLMTKCSLKLLAVLNDQEHDLQIHPDKEGTAYIDKTTGEFTFDNVTLYIPPEYPERETFKTPIRYKGVVSSSRCESPIEFFLDLPAEGVGQAPVLKRGMYDDKGVENYPSKFHKGGDGYVEGAPVFEFQRIMERFHYLPRGGADGVFGPNTEKAAKQFQTDSLDTPRVKESGGKLGQASRITYSDTVDGIVGPKTREEIAVWQREGYLRPLPDLYYDDYDREAVKRGLKSNRRGNDRDAHARRQADNDDYHDTGTPVLNAQQTLRKMDAYDGALDGWFFDKMKEAVKLFQSCAEKGEFLVNGVLTDIGEKLTGHQSGVLDVRTQEFMGKVGEVEGRVPKRQQGYGGFELMRGDKDGVKTWGGEKRERDGAFVAELQKDLFSLGYWISKGVDGDSIGKADGDFGKGTYSGVKTFQYEHRQKYGLAATGTLDRATADAIKQCVADKGFERPGIEIDPDHIDDGYCKYAKKKPEKPTRYYQLPPSRDGAYRRYGEAGCSTAGELGDVYHNDIWGAGDTIDAVLSLTKQWKSENDVVEIGDISRWDGRKFSAHSSHLAGYSVDVRSAKVGAMQRPDTVDNAAFDKDKSVEFARRAIALGFKYIITKCPHIAAECNKRIREADRRKGITMYVNLYDGHHHHFHMDLWEEGYEHGFPDRRYTERAFCERCVHKQGCKSEMNTTRKKGDEGHE